MLAIIGLGNPGAAYENSRHNAGWKVLDILGKQYGITINKNRCKAQIGEGMAGGHRIALVKPQTYMNLSGEAVKAAADFYKIPPEKIIVIFDDISLDVGRLRIRRKGSDGGHNGIKSIISCIGSQNFPRVKIGCGKKPHPDYDLAAWVLSEYKKDEAPELKKALDNACCAVELILDGKTDEAMNKYNS